MMYIYRFFFLLFFHLLIEFAEVGNYWGCSDIRKKGQEMACFHIFLDYHEKKYEIWINCHCRHTKCLVLNIYLERN